MKYSYCLSHHFAFDEADDTLHIYASIEKRKELMTETQVILKQREAYDKLRKKTGRICLYIHRGADSPFSEEAGTNPYKTLRLNDVPFGLHDLIKTSAKKENKSLNLYIQSVILDYKERERKIKVKKNPGWSEEGRDIKLFDIPQDLHAWITKEARRKRVPMRIFILAMLTDYLTLSFSEKS